MSEVRLRVGPGLARGEEAMAEGRNAVKRVVPAIEHALSP